MSFANPTKIKIGMTATLFGRTYRVIGRSVLGETEDSGTYYWNEFNLESSSGKYATLVFEETGSGGPWKFFEMFDPPQPMTAGEAATKREYDPVTLDNTPLHVTLVQRSRVYFTEGKMPEGVRVGQSAHYFNAEAGDKMVVVSWTGDEVEFFTGRTIPGSQVASAFNIGGLARVAFMLGGGRSLWNARFIAPVLLAAVVAFIVIMILLGISSSRRATAVFVLPTTASPLTVGESGVLEGRHFQIVRHAVVEIAEQGLRFTRHEYELDDDDTNIFLLISGTGTNAANWTLAEPTRPSTPMSPIVAAAIPTDRIVNSDAGSARIDKLFRSTIDSIDGGSPSEYKPGEVLYGFSGPMQSNILIVRWNATNIIWLKGKTVSDRAVKAAFAPTGK